MTNCIGEERCIPVHGNSPDSMCDRCETSALEAREAREKAVEAALGRFTAAIQSVRWSDDQLRILESLLKVVTVEFKRPEGAVTSCLLCGWTDGCKPGCATEAIAGLL